MGRAFLTNQSDFRDVSRGNPRPYTLKGAALANARLTPETWRLEIVSDGTAKVERQRRLGDGSAIDLPTLEKLGPRHGVKFFKAMQCLNIDQPLGQGLWEGVPLREVLKLAGKIDNMRRLYYWGFHNNDPKQLFQSSLNYTQVMKAPPWELGPFLAYRLNGQPLSLRRGGPVRMVVPWAHGFKSIKWLQRIVLTNDFRANDTYANNNNDPESYLKTAAYLDPGQEPFPAGQAVVITGTAMVGLSGLRRVEYWLRPDAAHTAGWQRRTRHGEPHAGKHVPLNRAAKDWSTVLPAGVRPREVWGFDRKTGRPREWPMRYSVAQWSVALNGLRPGAYEFRVRAVDLNGFANPNRGRISSLGGMRSRIDRWS